ncbi:MAG: diadenylate cyclase CdaA [Candidatus Pristimantibacillus lignocellulolyticus]|uniref:Diadenylate cyclase n=1 Tax=Candidatus Pristimantibacillus lignocellulolyticus TaxID=2994561 RepID=A0A9J6ZJ66_9BACL|nr:MAG: diadenylate cyclase CdaA [Candidatus Pristimantibacillus lignocellulolyticus]
MGSYFIDSSWQDWLKDIIDVGIVAFIIYKVMILVRGTRAVQLLKGVFVLVATWAISTWFNLYTLKWLMGQMFNWGIVMVLILFQPELRRALEQLGRGNFFSRGSSLDAAGLSEQIEEIIRAVRTMAKRKVGALIVFERKTGVSEMIESGIAMESKISSELLMNIFTPNSPLHDGAVIVRGNQIMAAGCYLPLSENPFISKELGTRHRAGIGVSEVSDAISLIVSEETGQISLSLNGLIVRDINEESLISKLHEELSPRAEGLKKESSILAFFKKIRGDQHG